MLPFPCSGLKLKVALALLILQPFRHFTYLITHSPNLPSFYLRHSSFSHLSVTSPISQVTPQHFRRFSYVTTHSPTLPLPHLRHSSFFKTFFRFSYVTISSLTRRAIHGLSIHRTNYAPVHMALTWNRNCKKRIR